MNLFTFSIIGSIVLLAGCISDVPTATQIRRAKMAKYLEEDFKRYPNMSVVMLNKCKDLAPQKFAPCTFSILDNDPELMMDMFKKNPYVLINLVNKHLAAFPDVPLRKAKEGGKCMKPAVTYNDQPVVYDDTVSVDDMF